MGDFYSCWGTSEATAHCSGVAALMFSKNACGSLSAFDAREVIYNNAWDIWWGYPYCPLEPQPRHVNALAAVDAHNSSCRSPPRRPNAITHPP